MAKKYKASSLKPLPYLYGLHAVKAALLNPQRRCHHLWVNGEAHTLLLEKKIDFTLYPHLKVHLIDTPFLASKVGEDATHQGIVLHADPLPRFHLETLIDKIPDQALVVVLDQISDPHNVGAVLRSAAAFGAHAVIQPEDHTPDPSNSIIAKVASGAVEHLPLINVTNLARALQSLKQAGFWVIGLDEKGEQLLSKVTLEGRIALVLGSEDKGMRRLTRENCDILASLPTTPHFPTLNVSNAAAISLYEFAKRQ